MPSICHSLFLIIKTGFHKVWIRFSILSPCRQGKEAEPTIIFLGINENTHGPLLRALKANALLEDFSCELFLCSVVVADRHWHCPFDCCSVDDCTF